MSELINNSEKRKAILKELLLKIHNGTPQDEVREELMQALDKIPYGEVVEVEQELIAEGLPEQEILQLCDVHSAVMHGNVDLSGVKDIPEGHPVDVFNKENKELLKVAEKAKQIIADITLEEKNFNDKKFALTGAFNELHDVDKHYLRKEYLLFPFLENQGITGPPKVMWGKHDEIRELIKGSIEILTTKALEREDFISSLDLVIYPAIKGVVEMVDKEEEILFPMALDKLTEAEWLEIDKQSLDIGFCLYDPQVKWQPEWAEKESINELQNSSEGIKLPSGGFTAEELLSILNTLPLDMTFVDKDDKVKYFSQGSERIFQRNRAILNRDVRHCHPPASAHIVDKIIDDFKTGKENRAPFWIQMKDKMIYIEYFALRNENDDYLGTLEVSHDVAKYRKLEGEQRILSYEK
jgi:DUF438 domain-containing protein